MKHDIRGNSEGNEKQIDTFFVKINQIFFPTLKSIDFAIFIYFFVTFYKYAIIFFLFNVKETRCPSKEVSVGALNI